jgi:hypothetical protein
MIAEAEALMNRATERETPARVKSCSRDGRSTPGRSCSRNAMNERCGSFRTAVAVVRRPYRFAQGGG